ncbi:M16 family metallopeptidase [Pontibacter silvestris]|uniref:M16 family metallopeptidase n=1 Tax=Pontibacter silvestris TaxID=2305183 RepID=A0ABW4WUK6_9BACT|nr:pitrilysin family protein [Pontibacter silvestris]MCC9136324.1 insulinase family protein [Pontibacter silvestris]
MLDRTKAPETYEIDAVSLQIAEINNLKNGARLHVIKSETQPVVRLDFVFKAGKWYEPESGVSDLTAKMLFEGTANHTAKQIAEKVAFYGASFDNNHGYDRTEFTLYCLAKYVEELLPLVLDVLQNPSFPEEEFNLLLQRTRQNVKVQRQKNSYLATHSFTKALYGDEHPYVFGFDSNAFDNITLDKLEAYYKSRFNVQELEVFACGSINEPMLQYLVKNIEELSLQRSHSSDTVDRIDIANPKKHSLVEMPESLQSSIRVGKRFPLIQHENYLKLIVLNEVLGGYFGSRLMRNIREDKGYTYGIYSTISAKEQDSLFYIGTDVNYAVTDDTISEIKKEIALLQQEEIQEDELNTVKNYMLGKFLNDIATIFDQCDRYKRIVLHSLSTEYYSNYVTTIRTVTAPELRELANTYLPIDDLTISVAGRNS